MASTIVRRDTRVPDLGGLALIGMAVMVAAVSAWMYGILLPGILGGFVLGSVVLLIRRRQGPYSSTDPAPRRDPAADWPPSDVINMSRIRVAGVGGLGFVAMAVVVALDFPLIAAGMTIAVAGGAALAGIVILLRRRKGPLISHGPMLHGRRPV